jgi:hypothetical protein
MASYLTASPLASAIFCLFTFPSEHPDINQFISNILLILVFLIQESTCSLTLNKAATSTVAITFLGSRLGQVGLFFVYGKYTYLTRCFHPCECLAASEIPLGMIPTDALSMAFQASLRMWALRMLRCFPAPDALAEGQSKSLARPLRAIRDSKRL